MRKLKILLMGLTVLLTQQIWAQSKSVTGKVTDSKDGSPISGASISARGLSIGTVSGNDGNFSLNVPDTLTMLIISFLDFETRMVPITSGFISISLTASEARSLNEVVVVGYGTRVRKDVISSISRVTSREFNNIPLPSFEQALQGRASGVFINSGSGKLGQALNIRVRGISSISANQQPFVVVDGVPIVNQALGSNTEPDNPLATINPDDIESIEVLKDAASSAIYGSRASNGVLLITTKSGKQGKTRVNAGFYTGWSNPTRKGEFLNAAQYREIFTAAAVNMGYDPADEFEAETGTDDWNNNFDTDWANEAFRKGSVQQYTVSVNGGDAKTRFLISASYNDQKGIILANRLNRGTVRFNVDHTINSIFKIGTNISLGQSNNFAVPPDNAFTNPLQLNALPPLHPLRDADGLYNAATLYYNNLIEQEGNNETKNKTSRTISNAFGEVTFSKALKFRAQVGLDWNNLQENQFLGRRTLDGAPDGFSFNNQVTATVFTSTNTLTYNKAFGDNHDFDGLAGIEYQRGTRSGASVTGLAFPSDKFVKIASAAIISDGESNETEFRFISYFARANYKFKDRYLLGASFRVDGSSRFGVDNRYGSFPAVSAGWIISEEDFLKNNRTLSFLKLRASYGLTGNAEIGNFSSRSLYEAGAYEAISGLVTSQIGDERLKWETTNQFDIGLDFGFINNRITGEIDYFNKKTKDLLLDVPVPAINGYETITKNIGDMTNHGFEFVLNGTILTGDFKWTSSVNLSTYKNEVTRLVAPVSPTGRTLGRLSVGAPFGQFYGKKYLGVDPQTGDAWYMDVDGKPTNDYNAAPDTVLGDPNPDFYGGWNNHFTYKSFDLDIQCQFVKGGDVFNIAGIFQSTNGDYFDNQTLDQMDYWRTVGQVTNIPQPRLYESNGTSKSSRWVQEGSYFRVKSVNLGYNFSRNTLRSLKMESARIYVAANNLFTFTKYKGYDPEVNAQFIANVNLGHDFYTPPQARTITIGINIGL